MTKTSIKITDCREVKEYPESQRKKHILFYSQGADEYDGSECDRYSYIAALLSMCVVEVDGDKETSVFPEGSEGALFEAQMMKEMAGITNPI
ncbi:MAG: hypothetical protein HUJ96_07445 [Marinilabiliaceae bacterium]|nr:hypothetical protein [Marinilabiliaceae bacterium]